MLLKNFTLSILFLFSFGFANAQCEIVNGSFEDWITTDFILPGEGGEDVSGEVMLPVGTTSVVRFLFLGFSAAFDPSFASLLETEAQALIGISQSTDASEGDFAVKLQTGYGIDVADIYSVFGCTDIPDQINIDVKHFGESMDSLTVIVVFDEGLGALPQTEADLEAYPAYANTKLGFNSNTEYETISIPIIQNFEAPIDTVYYVVIAETTDATYFLIDNVNFDEDNSGCQVFAPTLTMENAVTPICICNNLDVSFSLSYSTEPNFQYNELIVDETGKIVSIDDFIPGNHNEFCYPSNNLTAMVIAYEGQVEGLDEGSQIDELVGCFELSNELALETYSIPDFEFNVFVDGVQQGENIDICLLDDIVEIFSFSTDSVMNNIAIFLANDNDELIEVRIDDVNETTDFMGVPEDSYVLVAVTYDGSFNLEVGQDPDEITYEGCFRVSENIYEVNVLGSYENCVTDVEEVYSGKLSISPNFSNGLFEISNPNNETYQLVVRDISGKVVVSLDDKTFEGQVDLSGLPNGMYIASFSIEGFVHQEKLVKM